MIYIVKKSKKKETTETIPMSETKAKIFLCNLESAEFRTNKISIYGADTEKELNEVLNYFNKEYLVEDNSEEFPNVYTVNGNIKKPNRVYHRGITASSLENFKIKIEKHFPESKVNFSLMEQFIELLLSFPDVELKIICDYNLTILGSYLKDKKQDFISFNDKDKIIKEVNNMFRKQRYYYRKKER